MYECLSGKKIIIVWQQIAKLYICVWFQALDGFLFVVSEEGRLDYITENIDNFTNYKQDDLVGKDIFNYIHNGDHHNFMSSLLPVSLGEWKLFEILNNIELRNCTQGSTERGFWGHQFVKNLPSLFANNFF